MRNDVAGSTLSAVALGVLFLLPACTPAARQPRVPASPPPSREVLTPTAYPTMPPPESTAFPTPRPLVTPRMGPGGKIEEIGPEITFLGITRADGKTLEPKDTRGGIPTYQNFVGSGFQLVIEAKPGVSGFDAGRRIFVSEATDPSKRPDLELQVDRPLGDGSKVICDRTRPNIGGVPAIKPTSWAETQEIADTLNDMSCRFEVFLESNSSCTLGPHEDWQFRNADSKIQFCMTVAKAWNFPVGDTIVSARLKDTAGHPGPATQIRISRPKDPPTPRPRPTMTPTPKGLPVRP